VLASLGGRRLAEGWHRVHEAIPRGSANAAKSSGVERTWSTGTWPHTSKRSAHVFRSKFSAEPIVLSPTLLSIRCPRGGYCRSLTLSGRPRTVDMVCYCSSASKTNQIYLLFYFDWGQRSPAEFRNCSLILPCHDAACLSSCTTLSRQTRSCKTTTNIGTGQQLGNYKRLPACAAP
jgi:hypothetical protein